MDYHDTESDSIPFPSWGDYSIHLQADLWYGADDTILWPQAFVPEYPHLTAIWHKPTNPNDPLSIMWWNPTLFDFLLCPNSLVVGLGQLNPARYKNLYNCQCELNTHVHAYVLAAEKLSILIQNLLHTMNHSEVHICSLQTTFFKITFGVTEFQRCFLEVLSLINFLEIYEPHIQGQAPCATSAADCHGTFTNNPQFAQQLFDASLPLYLIRTHELVEANNPELLDFVSYFMPTDLIHAEVNPLSLLFLKVPPWITRSMPVSTTISRYDWSMATLSVIRKTLWIIMS